MDPTCGKRSYSIPGDFPSLAETARDLASFGEKTPSTPRQQYILSLVFEELATNSVKYGKCKELKLEVEFSPEEKRFFFQLRDDGTAFDPLAYLKENPREREEEDIPIGGAGLPLVQKMTDSFSYRREDNWNIVETSF